ncbi:MAG: helix-turn-helix transcriptional regulator [Clostridia bacterium]|nr:helix-turn-helix transcriptional regulator [Clostridia bacterium]
MKLEQAITQRINALCNEKGITTNKLANLAGLPSSTIRCIFYGRSKNPGSRTLLDICQALEITLFDFFNDPLFKDNELEGSY